MNFNNTSFLAEEQEQLDTQWYAVRVRSRFEATTSSAFRERGLLAFNPTYRSSRQWSDRIQKVDMPLFPGYVFCRFDASNLLKVLSSPGVVHVVSAGNCPIPVDDKEIEAVRSICQSGLPVAIAAPVVLGQRVVVVRGPLMGVEGTVIRIKEAHRLIASISLLQRAVSVELERAWIAPTEEAAPTKSPDSRLPLMQLGPGRAIGKHAS
jgi:transcriptional antiterminator NusG